MATTALNSAASGLSALTTQLEVISNNLANVNTNGFKASRTSFADLLYQEKALPGTENANDDQKPTGLYVGLGVRVTGTQLNFSQGSLQNTGRELDVAIEGKGFFQVEVEDERGAGGLAYTRAGTFAINADGELVLAYGDGRRLDPAITIPEEATSIEITSNGEVFVQIPGDEEPASIGNIQIANFQNPQGLRQIGENLYAQSAASGDPFIGDPGQDGLGLLVQRHVETSNVDPTIELIELIRTQRAYEMNSQSIRTADETLQAISQLRR